jgi:peptide/nickel transport system substrate-binding protein
MSEELEQSSSPRVSRRAVVAGGAAAAAGAGLVRAGVQAAPVGRPATHQTLRQDPVTLVCGWEEDAQSLDPSKTVGAHEARIVSLFGDTLWGLQGASSDAVPLLATEWSTSEDGLTWTAKLREGATFQDGTPVDAAAIKWSFDRWLDANHPFHDPPYGLLAYYLGAIQAVTVVDPATVAFTLGAMDATFANRMMVQYAAVVSPTAVEAAGNVAFGEKPVCTGAYQVTEWERGVRIVLDRNPGYWGEAAKIDRIVIRPIVENAARLTALQQGEVDFIVAMSPEFIPMIQADPNLQLIQSQGNHIWWIALNTHEEPMKDVRVRQALNYAIDKQAIVDTILQGAATLSNGPIIQHSWGNDEAVSPYPFDPEKAKALLAEAGYADGFSTKFWVPESGSGMIAPKEIAQIVQADLANIGVTVEIVTQEWTSYVADWGAKGLDAGPYGMGEMSWNFSSPDPSEWLNPNIRTDAAAPAAFNGGFYSNAEVDELLTAAVGTMVQDERAGYYKQAQAILREDCPWIFMFSANNIAAASARLKGVELNPSPSVVSLQNAYFE